MGKLKPHLAEQKFRGTKYLAIDLDPEGLLVVSGPVGENVSRVEHAHAWLPGEEHGPAALSDANAKQLGEELHGRLEAAGFPAGPVLVGIGRDKVILKEVKHPPAPPEAEPSLVRFQALKEIGENPDEIVLDYAPLSDAGADASADRRAVVVVVKKDFYETVKMFVESAGYKLAAVTPRPFAVAAGLSEALENGKAQQLDSPGDAAAIVSLTPAGGEFTILRHGKVVFTRAIPAPALLNDALLLGEIRRNLTTWDGQNTAHPVKAIYVPEAESTLGGWGNRLRNGLAIPVHSYDPVATAAEPVPSKLRGRYAGAAGLLAGRAVGLPINFASPRQPKVKRDPRKPLFIGAAVAALILILAGGVVGYMALDAAEENLKNKQAQKESLEQQINNIDADHKRVAAAEQWEGRGVNLLDELFEMSRRMPANDTLRVNKITGTAIRVDKTGKQNGQAFFTLNVGAKTSGAAADLVSAIDRDNTKDKKFYLNTRKIVGGIDTHSNVYNQLATIETTVNHRSPNEYTGTAMFTVPKRGVIVQPAPKTETEKKPDDGFDEIP
jgi:hypothetical protein